MDATISPWKVSSSDLTYLGPIQQSLYGFVKLLLRPGYNYHLVVVRLGGTVEALCFQPDPGRVRIWMLAIPAKLLPEKH